MLSARHDAAVTAITPGGESFTVAAGAGTLRARHVVLATGMGAWRAPAAIAALLRQLWAHSADAIDFAALRGRRVAVIRAGASAFDNAAAALQAGVARMDMQVRGSALPRSNPNRWIEFTGSLDPFGNLPDATRLRMIRHIIDRNRPPPQESFSRCAAPARRRRGADRIPRSHPGAALRRQPVPPAPDLRSAGTGGWGPGRPVPHCRADARC